MADEDQDSKTEQPTSRRLDKAREQGNVLQSQEVKTAAMLTAMLVVVWLGLPVLINLLKNYLAGMIDHLHEIRIESAKDLVQLGTDIVLHMMLALAVPFAIMIAVAFASSLGQTGFMLVLEKLAPDFSKVNPLAGLKRIFSMHSVVELIKSVAKLTLVGVGCYMFLKPRVKELELLMSMDLISVVVYIQQTLVKLIMAVVIMMLVLAGGDWFYQRFTFMKNLRMSRQEIKDENKDTEGDPMIKSRLRSLRIARARQRMMANVPKADVVITNPTHFACALKYDMESMGAPVLIAKGQDFTALKIREVATEHEIPIVENPPLARALFAAVEIDQEIPPEHYKAVAEVISYVMRLKEKSRGKFQQR
jgi:flagellar biosynthetic protein FlhB